jgi:FkbM family methyltransferase
MNGVFRPTGQARENPAATHDLAHRIFERRIRRTFTLPSEPDCRAFRYFRNYSDFLFLDIGANAGQTIDAERMQGWQCRIVAFEPNPNLAEGLRQGYGRRDAKLEVREEALSDTDAHAKLFVPHYRGLPFDGLASLSKDKAVGWLSPKRLVRFDPRHLTCREFEVKLQTLDAVSLKPDFIKLDVQGAELAVLRGALNTIEQTHPGLLLEAPKKPDEISSLEPLGYASCAFDGKTFRRGRLGAVNSFFFTEDFLQRFPLPTG